MTKTNARITEAVQSGTRFADVAGYAAVKTEIGEVVDYLRDPARYRAAGARARGAYSWPGRPAPARP
jgi:cell division protease FtsH